ncbi:Inactive Polypeptide N-Acetylgalactosaminyltransferase-Like Protein 5 [Manis pentadactyla]|nr:Inactive Polypeptide N-Acetylgalactosaminyltransferase-Like Protein 5 [Manis pentadactyla]
MRGLLCALAEAARGCRAAGLTFRLREFASTPTPDPRRVSSPIVFLDSARPIPWQSGQGNCTEARMKAWCWGSLLASFTHYEHYRTWAKGTSEPLWK